MLEFLNNNADVIKLMLMFYSPIIGVAVYIRKLFKDREKLIQKHNTEIINLNKTHDQATLDIRSENQRLRDRNEELKDYCIKLLSSRSGLDSCLSNYYKARHDVSLALSKRIYGIRVDDIQIYEYWCRLKITLVNLEEEYKVFASAFPSCTSRTIDMVICYRDEMRDVFKKQALDLGIDFDQMDKQIAGKDKEVVEKNKEAA